MEIDSKAGAGRSTLVQPLGRRGMGEVWLAQNERLHEQVALKFLPPEVRADPVALDDLRRETARSHKVTNMCWVGQGKPKCLPSREVEWQILCRPGFDLTSSCREFARHLALWLLAISGNIPCRNERRPRE